MKRIAVLTSGGDAPGMNAAIRAATRTAVDRGAEVLGVRRGYAGLIEGDFIPLTARDVSGILEFGGTILESDRCLEFKTPEGRERAKAQLNRADVQGLIVVGGDGSQTGALALSSEGFAVNGVASTIDNDLPGSDVTIGVDTAINVALEAIDRLRTTASSHRRLFIVEVMGRNCGYLALAAGLAGGAEVIVSPEHDLSPGRVVELLHEARLRGKRHAVVVVAEGARTNGRTLYQHLRDVHAVDFDPRLTILGHIQRGARPGAFDRLLATRLAARAAEMLVSRQAGYLIGLRNGAATATPLVDVIGQPKPLPAEFLALAETMQL
ncbi:MAG: ATP-dependent 6-phosphofructokinase [Planctomycetia bacterium]|nr:ATP-dependent 6-phosphofructokinase [Planctomycetia bacterium]